MLSTSLKDLFVPVKAPELVVETEESESEIFLMFRYGLRNYATGIDSVKEIMDFPLIIPFPVDVGNHLGVMNLRGTIVPIIDPERYFMEIQDKFKSRSHEEFTRMKLRLIVFETAPGMIVALPVTEVGKTEVSSAEVKNSTTFLKINDRPYEKFEINTILEGDA